MKRLKIIHAGKVTEIYKYPPNMVWAQERRNHTNTKKSDDNKDQIVHQRKQKNRKTIMRLANNNFNQNHKFITFTYAKKTNNHKQVKADFKAFIRRLSRNHTFKDLRYLGVIEPHKDGSLHVHALLSIGYIEHRVIAKHWGLGFIKINNIKTVDNLGAYIVKYISKGITAPPRTSVYIRSKNLLAPEVVESNDTMFAFKHINNYKRKYSYTYPSDFGIIHYTQFIR